LDSRAAIQRILEEALPPRARRLAPLIERECKSLSRLDRAFVREVVLGVSRNLLLLDRIVQEVSARRGLPAPRVLAALRSGLYQVLFMDRVPAFAAVDRTVAAARAAGKGAAGFVNACLRKVAARIGPGAVSPGREVSEVDLRGRKLVWPGPLLPDPGGDRSLYLSVRHSHPIGLVRRWLARLPPEVVEAVLASGTAPPSIQLRVNRLRAERDAVAVALRAEGFPCEPLAHPWSLRVLSPVAPVATQAFERGLFTVQDSSALIPSDLLAPLPGERVLDLCAAPGGKTTHLAELMGDRGEVVAFDADPVRLELVEENARRLGLRSIRCVRGEEALAAELATPFDRVLLDAPCSNTGVLGRRVEARWRWSEGQLRALVEVQAGLLARALGALAPRGVAVYSTCSIEPEENEGVVRAGLAGRRLAAAVETFPSRPDHDGGFAGKIEPAD
jgi:16S rRNA (cytosine967-C5)-methyltransferase